jgi:hypothetical protein
VTALSIPGPKGHQKVPGHKGISYRFNADGSKSYYVYVDSLRKQGRTPYVLAGRTQKEALAKQAEIRSRKAKGEKTLVASRATFGEVAELWFEQRADRLAASSGDGYRFALDRVLLPASATGGSRRSTPTRMRRSSVICSVRDCTRSTCHVRTVRWPPRRSTGTWCRCSR